MRCLRWIRISGRYPPNLWNAWMTAPRPGRSHSTRPPSWSSSCNEIVKQFKSKPTINTSGQWAADQERQGTQGNVNLKKAWLTVRIADRFRPRRMNERSRLRDRNMTSYLPCCTVSFFLVPQSRGLRIPAQTPRSTTRSGSRFLLVLVLARRHSSQTLRRRPGNETGALSRPLRVWRVSITQSTATRRQPKRIVKTTRAAHCSRKR